MIIVKNLIIIILLTSVSLIAYGKSNDTSDKKYTLYSNVDVYLTDGTIVNGAVEYPISIYEESITVKLGKHKKKTYYKNEVTKVIYKIAGHETIYVKLKHTHQPIMEDKDDEIFVEELIKGKTTIYYGLNYGYLIKKRKSTLINDTNLFFCKREDENTLSLLHADTNDAKTIQICNDTAQKYFNSKEILNLFLFTDYGKLKEYVNNYNKQ